MLRQMRKVTVPLGDRSYIIHVGTGLLARLGRECSGLGLGNRCAVITDQNVDRLYRKEAIQSLESAGIRADVISISPGETAKSLKSVQACYDRLAAMRLERGSFILALGGGVVGDLAGFLAATYLRCVGFVQVPTTLLAQVDSSVGGKVGVNLKAGKNLVGAFYQPRLVLCDLDTLDSLPLREHRAGLAEVIKYGIIYDAALFRRLERDLDKLLKKEKAALGNVIARCCAIKSEVVGQDEKEGGLRAILNFGHTIGHALEAISAYGKHLHGEAISIGQVAAARLSRELSGLPPSEELRVERLFARAGLPTGIHLSQLQRTRLFEAMQLDKKVSDGEVKFVLAERIGRVRYGLGVPSDRIHAVLDSLSA
jgi:3-dehydroquinate synthase